MVRSLLLCALFSTAVLAQPNPFLNPIIRNAASGRTGIAQGSYMSVTNAINGWSANDTFNLTTADGVGVQLAPITPPNLASITSPGGAPLTLWFVIPPNARVGSALLTISRGGSAMNYFIEITSVAPGLFSSSYSGTGPALALNHPSTRNALTSAAVPGGIVSLFATGLNGARASDVTVELADRIITPLYAGPQGQPGLDQINFVVPQNVPIGCYVPVAIRVRGVLSNQTTLSINGDSFACAHPLGLTYSDLKTLDAGGTVQLADFGVSRDSNPVQGPGEGASMTFLFANATNVALQSGVQTTDAQLFSCNFANILGGPGGGVQLAFLPNPGTMKISGPNGKQIELQRKDGYYSSDVPTDNPPFFSAGLWQLSGSGSSELGAFQQNFALPPSLKYTNLENSTVIPSQGYTLRWDGSGFGSNDIMSVNLNIAGDFTNYASCTAPAWAGQLVLPNSVLETFKGRSTVIITNVRPRNGTRALFSIPNNNGTPIRGFVDYSYIQRITASVQ